MTENSLNSFWSSSILISVIIGGCVLLLMYIIRLFKNDNQKGKVASVKNVTRHSEKETNTKGKKKSTETKWAVRAEKQHTYTHPWLLTTLKGHTGHVLDMDFSSSGKYLASCSEEPDPGGFADVDTSSSTSSSLEDAPVNTSHLHSGPGPLKNHIDASSATRKPGLSRRQRKNRRREDTSIADKKKHHRRYQSNPAVMYQPLRQHMQLNLTDAQLSMMLHRYKLPTALMGCLSYPIDSEPNSGRVLIIKGQSSVAYNNHVQLQHSNQFFRRNRSRPRFDVNAREFIPNEPVPCVYYTSNAQAMAPMYFYGAIQEAFARPVVAEKNLYQVRECLKQLNVSEITNSSDEDYTMNNIPTVVYTRTANTAFLTNPRPTVPNYMAAQPMIPVNAAEVDTQHRDCNTPPPQQVNNNNDQTNGSSNLVLSPRSQFKQSVWEAANDNTSSCPEPRANINNVTQNNNTNVSTAQQVLQNCADDTYSGEVYVTLLTVLSDNSSTTSSSGNSSSSSRSQSSEALNEYTESSDFFHNCEPPTFHYSPEGALCFCTNHACTRGLPDILVDVLPVARPGEPHTCVRCTKQFFISRSGEYLTHERCHYHWGKLHRMGADTNYGQSDYYQYERVPYLAYSCCGMGEGTPGCTKGKLHVWTGIEYGVNGPYDSFVRTRARRFSPADGNHGIYAVDCEMCYTARGLELTKVTVIASDGRLVYDCFVRPDVEIIDYNTRYSGITARDLNRKGGNIKSLKDVQNDLMGFISAETILVGHGLENDLRALKIVHGAVVDTSVTFPHVQGLPYRRSLKSLVNIYLNRDIQTSSDGHNSYEDARACMDLILWKIKNDYCPYMDPTGQ